MTSDPVRPVLDSQELFPSTCSSPLPLFFFFFFFPRVFISQYVSARPFIHLCVFLLVFIPLPLQQTQPFPLFPPRLLIPGPLRAAQQTSARGSDDARLTPMSISSDLSYQPSSRLGRKIMNSSSAGFSFFFSCPPCRHPAAVLRVIIYVPLSPRMERRIYPHGNQSRSCSFPPGCPSAAALTPTTTSLQY